MGSENKNTFAASTRRSPSDETGLSDIAAPAVRPDEPLGGRFSLSRRTVAERRHETLRRFNRLKKHHSAETAARKVGASIPTLWRWQKKFAARGLDGLKPGQPGTKKHSSPFEQVRLTGKALRALELLNVEHVGNGNAAWRQFAQGNAGCPPLLADYIQRTGRVHPRLAGLGRVRAVALRGYVSADGRRIYIKLPVRGTLAAKLAVPKRFNFVKVKA